MMVGEPEELEKHRILAGLPKRCLGMIERLCVTEQNGHAMGAVEDCLADFEQGRRSGGIYLHGPTGTGKTCLLSSLALTLRWRVGPWFDYRDRELQVFNGQPVRAQWWFVPTLFDKIYKSLRHDDEDLDDLATCDALFLDDLGKTAPTEWATKRLFAIINQRWEAGLATFYSSNLAPEELGRELCRELGSRGVSDVVPMIDRIRETCRVRELRGESWRNNTTLNIPDREFLLSKPDPHFGGQGY